MLNKSGGQGHKVDLGTEQALKYAQEFSNLYRTEKQERRELEKAHARLKAYADELVEKNIELKEFTFIASHDLREPLRKIVAFGDRLKHSAGDLNDQAQAYLDCMQKSALRMESFIEDLLRFSRVNTHAQPYAPVKLEEVAFEVIEDLNELILRTKGKVSVNALPVVNGDRLQIKQLLLNLVSNALKFYQPGKPPEVSLNSRADEAENWEITIQDNGMGFDEKYMSEVFKPFGRLGKNDECGGTGMGLAICRKIVKRHGGRIAARSKPGEGSTFSVTFPKK